MTAKEILGNWNGKEEVEISLEKSISLLAECPAPVVPYCWFGVFS